MLTVMILEKHLNQLLNENTVPSPITQVTAPHIRDDTKRENENFSISHATAGSIKEIAEVHAAESTIRRSGRHRAGAGAKYG